MTTANQARYLHRMLDRLVDKDDVSPADIEKLRAELPELPAQKTLEELQEEVYERWLDVEGDEWDSDNWGTVEAFLGGLLNQLDGLIDAEPTHPALPEGMRIAEHEKYGRVVVSPKSLDNGSRMIFVLDKGTFTGTECEFVPFDSLTFIDTEPEPAPAHPEFLETEEDYRNAPVGTVAIREMEYPWTRIFGSWVVYSRNEYSCSEMALRGKARVLRWGNGDEK